ncbi:hypothetical protein HK099_005820 [Clydaea vesicula]|uniref:HTH APSES-type domain-containing protein n=1 Tax=Clydaea vesicula TaxID=447962 RepID=A0AAD5TYL2_9FUNG|nr:hypothetical protein HK099_005820 [Clydaea vesicula]
MSDAYMNATHILKVAGFSKPKRTKILEKEVLQGQHEKIQGGYGKYQGTWIPFDVSRKLARRYDVECILNPLFDFDPQKDKIGVKPVVVKQKKDDQVKVKKKSSNSISQNPAVSRNLTNDIGKKAQLEMQESVSKNHLEDTIKEHFHDLQSSKQNCVTPTRNKADFVSSNFSDDRTLVEQENFSDTTISNQQSPLLLDPTDEYMDLSKPLHSRGFLSPSVARMQVIENLPYSHRQKEVLLRIFKDRDYCSILNLLRTSSYQFDINLILDLEGNTSLHWASALAKVDLIKQLIYHGANKSMRNRFGVNPLIKSVQYGKNFELQTFDKTLELFKDVVFEVDFNKKSLLHHIILRFSHLEKNFTNTNNPANYADLNIELEEKICFYYFKVLIKFIKENFPYEITNEKKDATTDIKLEKKIHSRNKNFIMHFFELKDHNGNTCLNLASKYKLYFILEELLKFGCDKNSIDLKFYKNDLNLRMILNEEFPDNVYFEKDILPKDLHQNVDLFSKFANANKTSNWKDDNYHDKFQNVSNLIQYLENNREEGST